MGIALRNQMSGGWLRGILLLGCLLLPGLVWAQTPLSLPFFDDFASVARSGSEQPDPARWQSGSGVYINNTMAIRHPSLNVATFDGLRADGQPYSRANALDQGYTDTLQSLPINLSGLAAADNVYLSFYWQTKGLGELPDPGDTLYKPQGSPPVLQPGDSLTLQFRNTSGNWVTVWGRAGGQADSSFNQAILPITNAAYLHANFAFRFRTYGRRTGPFDTWNVDYIYLDKNRNPNAPTFRYTIDVATEQALSPLLKRYYAMPMSQYRIQGSANLADSVTTVINNLIPNPNPIPHRLLVRDLGTGQVLQNVLSAPVFVSGFQQRSARPNFTVNTNRSSARLSYEIDLETSDRQNVLFQRDPSTLVRNDSISAITTLDNYYAYDDGSWEYAYQIHQREQIAVRFVLDKPDTVAGVRACMVPFTNNQSGQPFVLTVYANNGGKPGIALYQQQFAMQYPGTRNGFVDYTFTKSVIVRDTFFVGYQQISSADTTLLRLGFDKTSPFGQNIFYNGGANWQQNLQTDNRGNAVSSFQVPGAFMLRPVMGGKLAVVTVNTEPVNLPLLRAYPNPTTGLIRWELPRMNLIEVLSLGGQSLLRVEPSPGQQTLDLSQLPDGLYLLRLNADQRTTVQKLIVNH